MLAHLAALCISIIKAHNFLSDNELKDMELLIKYWNTRFNSYITSPSCRSCIISISISIHSYLKYGTAGGNWADRFFWHQMLRPKQNFVEWHRSVLNEGLSNVKPWWSSLKTDCNSLLSVQQNRQQQFALNDSTQPKRPCKTMLSPVTWKTEPFTDVAEKGTCIASAS